MKTETSISVKSFFSRFVKEIPDNVKIVAATKYVDAKAMLELYNHGIKDYGENRTEAFLEKYEVSKKVASFTGYF